MKTVTFQGNPLTLSGNTTACGEPAPDFTALNNGLEPISAATLKGKITVLLSVPSLDTPVCDMEVRRFNQEINKLSADVQIICLSMDLPFAQARWCGAAGIDNVMTLSDHYNASFGMAYGVLINELRLLSRAVFVVNSEGKIAYQELLVEITDQPDYDKALAAVASLIA